MTAGREHDGGWPPVVPFSSVATVVVACDLLSKWVVFRFLQFGLPVDVVPGLLRLRTIHNEGAVFGFGRGLGPLFIGLTVVAAAAIVWAVGAYGRSSRVLTFGLSLLFGGAVGNLWDRVAYGHVRDFIDFYVGRFHWPTFNLADTAICAGAAVIVIHAFWSSPARLEKRSSSHT